MKKIFTIVSALMLIAFSAHAEKRIGVSGAFSMFDSSGTEEVKSSGTKNSGSHDETVIVPSLFVEFANDSGLTLGLDYVPVEAEIGSSTNARTDTDTDDASDTAGDNKAAAELTGHFTAYILAPVGGNGTYLKGGIALATIETTESLATGTTYGNEDVYGMLIGAGFNRDLDNGMFLRTEATYTDYQDVSFTGSADSDSVRNKIEAEVDALAFRISIGKAF
jgi:opacity protein-like surface antigen